MKNLKKLLAMSLAFAMIFSCISALFVASAYDDVTTANAGLYEAVSVLSDIGIVNGKDANNFGAADNIKRSEAAAILVRMLGKDAAAEASKGKTDYTDVAADHWATGYINVASGAKIINGNGDGTFAPDENVTYEQFLKMVVVALGYTDVAEGKGGYPTGYVIVANDLGLTKGIKVAGTTPATRADIALIVYSAMSTPLREQTKFGSDPEFEIYDGDDGNKLKTLLSKYLDIKKFRVIIESDGRSTLKNAAMKGKIGYTITDDFDLNDSDYKEDVYVSGLLVNDYSYSAKIGKSDAANYLGYRAIVYVGQDEFNEDYVVSVVPDTSRVKELKISGLKYMDLATTENEGFDTNQILYYWLDPDNDKKSLEANLASNAVMLVNGQKVAGSLATNAADYLDILKNLENGSVKLVNNDSNSDDLYDYIFVTTYLQGVVEEVDVDNKVITLEGDLAELSFNKDDFPDSDFTYTLKDKNGVDVDLKTITKNDVIAVAFSDNDRQMAYSDYMDVIVIKDKVTGTITELNANGEYKIDGKYFEESNSNDVELALENSGTFYLDIDGKIIFKTKDPNGNGGTTNYNYAYLIDVGTTGGIDSNYQVQVFNKEGQVKTLSLASSVKVNFDKYVGVSFTSTGTNGKSKADLYTFLTAYIDDTSLTAGDVDEISTGVGNAIANLAALRALSTNNKIASRIVDINVNADGAISRITFPNVKLSGGAVSLNRDSEDFTFSYDANNIQYNANSKSFANRYKLVESTKVFYVPADSMNTADDIELRSTSSFTEDKDYDLGLFDLNSNNEIGLVVLSSDDGFPAYDSRLAVVDRLGTTIDAEGNELDVITMVQDGKSISKTVSSKGIKAYQLGTKASVGTDIDSIGLAPGDAIQFTVNGTDYINNIAKIFDFATKTLYDDDTAPADDPNTPENENVAVNEDATYVFAKVWKGGSSIEIEAEPLSTELNKAASADVRYAEFDDTLQRTSKASVISSSGIKSTRGDEKYYIVARMYAGQAMDIIQYKVADDVPDANLKIANA